MLVAIPGAPNACAASSTIGRPKPPQLVDRRRPAEQVHRHHRLRPLRDPPLDVGGIEVERRGLDLGEDGRRAAARDRLGRRVERERRADHLVARADAQRVEDEHERVGAVRDADRLLDAELLGRLALEALDLGAEDEAAALERPRERLLQLRDERRVLRLDVNVGNRRHGESMVVERRRRTIQYADAQRRSRHDRDTRRTGSRGAGSSSSRRAPSPRPRARSTRWRCRSAVSTV